MSRQKQLENSTRVEVRLDQESLEIINQKKQELNVNTTSEAIRQIIKQSASA